MPHPDAVLCGARGLLRGARGGERDRCARTPLLLRCATGWGSCVLCTRPLYRGGVGRGAPRARDTAFTATPTPAQPRLAGRRGSVCCAVSPTWAAPLTGAVPSCRVPVGDRASWAWGSASMCGPRTRAPCTRAAGAARGLHCWPFTTTGSAAASCPETNPCRFSFMAAHPLQLSRFPPPFLVAGFRRSLGMLCDLAVPDNYDHQPQRRVTLACIRCLPHPPDSCVYRPKAAYGQCLSESMDQHIDINEQQYRARLQPWIESIHEEASVAPVRR